MHLFLPLIILKLVKEWGMVYPPSMNKSLINWWSKTTPMAYQLSEKTKQLQLAYLTPQWDNYPMTAKFSNQQNHKP